MLPKVRAFLFVYRVYFRLGDHSLGADPDAWFVGAATCTRAGLVTSSVIIDVTTACMVTIRYVQKKMAFQLGNSNENRFSFLFSMALLYDSRRTAGKVAISAFWAIFRRERAWRASRFSRSCCMWLALAGRRPHVMFEKSLEKKRTARGFYGLIYGIRLRMACRVPRQRKEVVSMSQANILLIEDEKKIARLLKLELEYEGYEVTVAEDGAAGLDCFKSAAWDLVLLDVMIPRLSGMEVLRRIRTSDALTPVILVTARDSLPDKVSGLDLGANDYITKPFAIEELLARIRACLRMAGARKKEEEEAPLRVGDLFVDEKKRLVMRGESPVELTPREFDLLVYLVRHVNQVLGREQILNEVWGYDYYGDTNIVDVYIRYLRKKLDDPAHPPLISTVRGIGYSLKEQKG